MLTLSSLKQQSNKGKENQNSDEKNQGGFWEGLGYLGGSFLAGVGGVGEGVIDALLALGADLTGNHEFAESLFKNNVVGDWHQSITEDYNPTGIMQFLGDVSSGIGQSAYLFIPYAGVPLFFTGVMSQGVSGAAEKTGDVGIKEVAYGLTTGAIEGSFDVAFSAAGKGARAIASASAKLFGKSAVKSVTTSAVRQGLASKLLSSAASEFLEEAASEVIDTGLQRAYQIDPDKELSIKDVLYAGAVGAVSGGVTAGAVNIPMTISNTKRGAKVIKNGNEQTLVNTANKVADRIAAQGTNFEKGPEWVKTLRGEVDAYNKLSDDQKKSLKGQTILGEMQASLYYAETQSIVSMTKQSIMNADEQTRATLAEYINRSYDKSQRKKDFTAEDIKNNTNDIAQSLAVMKFVGYAFDFDGAIADMEQEREIAKAIAEESPNAQNISPLDAMAQEGEISSVAGVNDTGAQLNQNEIASASIDTSVPQMDVQITQESPIATGEVNANAQEVTGEVDTTTQEVTGEVDLEKAKRDAERIIEWEKKNAPTVEELNTAREYVKGFDNMDSRKKSAIIRMVRSSSNVDAETVKGVANLIAVNPASDLEVRFSDTVDKDGIAVKVGKKTAIIINSDASKKATYKGTIAHELVHYLEGREGYEEFAKFVRDHAKAEAITKQEKKYREYYKKQYTAEEQKKAPGATESEIAARVAERMSTEKFEKLIDSEVTGALVGNALNSDKLLSRYANRDKKLIKRIFDAVKQMSEKLDDEDADEVAKSTVYDMIKRFDVLLQMPEGENGAEWKKKYSVIQKDGKYYTPTDEEIIKNHPTINGVIINDAEYSEGHKLPDDEYKMYREKQVKKAEANFGVYTNKDTVYSDQYGQINAEFRNITVRKGKSYGGIALYDILPHIPQIFENAVVLNTKPDDKSDPHIKGIVDLVGTAILNNEYLVVVKLNVKEYTNDDAKIYDNKVLTIEELTVVERESHQKNDSTSSAVSSRYIISKFREFVNTSDEKKSSTNSDSGVTTKKKYDIGDAELNEDGEVKDEYFEAAIRRAQEDGNVDAEAQAQAAAGRTERAIDARKEKFNKALAKAVKIQRKIEKLKNSTETDAKEQLKKAKKEYNSILADISTLTSELRQLGYDINAEQRKIEQLQKQNENQQEQISDLKAQKRELERIEREDRILQEAEKREQSRQAKLYAEQRAEIGKVYSEPEIKRELKNMLDQGLVSKFFGGEYMPNVDNKEINAIARYIALQLNLAGESEKAEAQGLVTVAAQDLVRNMYFIDENGGKVFLHQLVDTETANQFTDMLRTELVEIMRNAGELNPYAELQRAYGNVRRKYLEKLAQTKEYSEIGKEFPKTLAQAVKMRKLSQQKKGIASDSVQKVLDQLGKVADDSGRLRIGKIDEAMRAASLFFEAEQMKLNSQRDAVAEDNRLADDSIVEFSPQLIEDVNEFVQKRMGREGTPFTSAELKKVGQILQGMRTTLERYNKEQIGNRYVDIDQAAGGFIQDSKRQRESKTFISKMLDTKVGKALRDAYFYQILSPETVIESLEYFKADGVLKTLFHDIRTATQKSETISARLKHPFAEFIDSNDNRWQDEKGHSRSFRVKLNQKTVSVDGVDITLGEAINLYMLTKRDHAHLGLREGGYVTYDDEGKKKVKIKIDDIEVTRNNLYAQFDDTDRAFVKMAETFFNETASKIKYDADMKIFGYSNNQEGYYVPIIRDRYSRINGVTDLRQSVASVATVYNKSFTKNIVQNQKAIEGQNILRIINDHADGLADYANLYIPLKAFDRVYNRRIAIDGAEVTSVREILNNDVWKGTEKYLKNLFDDIQGVSRGDVLPVERVAGWIRSGWVSSVLGANIKVVFTQTTSLGAATQVIDAKHITKASWIITPGAGFAEGVQAIADRADKYSDIIFARHFEMGALKAQGNIDKVGEIAKKTGGLIEWMDRKVCVALFHAAELSVEESTGHKVGTEENAKLAAQLADEAIYTTQAMSSKAEKSALQRSKSEIAKMFSMFTSDSVKNLSHFMGNLAKWNAHKNRAANGEAEYENLLKKDAKAIKRSARTMAITGVMLGLISQMFKYLYAKEEEEPEDKVKDFAVDIASSTLNVFPIVSDLVDKIVFDYDMSINTIDALNDVLETFGNSFDVAGRAISGQYVSERDIHKATTGVLKSGLSLFGIPISPVERTVTGLLRRFAPSAVYGYDAATYSPTYTADLKKAVEGGDEALAEHVLATLYQNEATGTYSTPELEEIARLYALTDENGKHYNVLPQKIGTEINGTKLDRKQRKQFEGIYSQASDEVNKLIRSDYYLALTDEQRAKAIKNIYSLYYNRAAAEVVGEEWSNAQAYSRLTSNYAALFSAQAYKSGLTAYRTIRGKEVTVKEQFVEYARNLGLSEADLLVVLYANGYRDKSTKAAMIAYINSLPLSDLEKSKIAERLGFDYRDGIVSEKEDELEVRDN